MKFLRFGPPGEERPGVLDANGRIRDLSDMMSDLAGPNLARLGRVDPEAFPVVEGAPRLGPPVAGVGKVVCLGAGAEAPAVRADPALAGPNDALGPGREGDVALGVVIGRAARAVREEEALAHVAGYAVFTGLAAGPGERRAGGACGEGTGPLGPWLVTPDEVGDPQRLAMELTVNGETIGRGTTAGMRVPVAGLLSRASAVLTLEAGDIVAVGLPGATAGLEPGDVVEAWIEGLGRQRQVVAAG